MTETCARPPIGTPSGDVVAVFISWDYNGGVVADRTHGIRSMRKTLICNIHSMSEEEICCPKFDPALWDGKVLDWTDKKFVRDYCNLLDFGSAMKRVSEKMKRSGALMQDGMRLSDRISA